MSVIIHITITMAIRRLRHVMTVDECGSITRAAEQLGLTQSAITKSIADTEREIGYLRRDTGAPGFRAGFGSRNQCENPRKAVSYGIQW